MKKNTYKCAKCDRVMNSERRDPGTPPVTIGCVNETRNGTMRSHHEMVDQESDIEPEYIFFKPKDKSEWKSVEKQLFFEITRDHPKWNGKKVIKHKNKFLTRIKRHVHNGGLCFLPIEEIPPKVMTIFVCPGNRVKTVPGFFIYL